ncbi:putative Bracovirus protein MdBV-1-19 [Microplitis demolitor]
MNTVIDFNGYFVQNQFKIKEYSLYLIHAESCNVIQNNFEVSTAPCTWDELDPETQQNYQRYQLEFGIDWDTGSQDCEINSKVLNAYLKRSNYIFISDKDKKKLLLDYIKNDIEDHKKYNFIYLDDLGYFAESKRPTTCSHHKSRKSICANDGVLKMYNWLKNSKFNTEIYRRKIHTIVDFAGCDLPRDVYEIKEFSAYSLNVNGNLSDSYYKIVGPPFENFEQLPLAYKFSYDYFYDMYGIGWTAGTCVYKKLKKELKNYFKFTTYVYVRNLQQKNLLKKLIGDLDCTFVCLNKFGYNVPLKMITKCESHDNPHRNICARDISRSMTKWLQENVMYKLKIRNEYLNRNSNFGEIYKRRKYNL